MRRKDREISDINEKLDIIKKCKVCRIAMYDGKETYIVPMNFGFSYENEQLVFYFHSAKEGRKVDILKSGYNQISFEMDCSHSLIEAVSACGYGYEYESIMGNGKTVIIDEPDEKIYALNKIMEHQTGKTFIIDGSMSVHVLVFKIIVNSFTGKHCFIK